MNLLNLFVNSYSKLKNYGMPYWVMTPVRRLVRKLAYKWLPKYLNKPVKRSPNTCEGLIVSFTSFPARINEVWQVVECMKRQTLLPEKIILWLSKEQFPNRDSIPETILNREDDLFSIRFVEGNIRSHKKYYYVSKEYPNKMIFLIDDDIYYDTDILNRSINEFNDYGGECVVCNYGFQMKYNTTGSLPYSQWDIVEYAKVGKDLFFGSGGGTLFRPLDLYRDLTDIDLALRLTPIADDIWLNTMVLKSALTKIMLPHGPLLNIEIEDNVTLTSVNNEMGRNDDQILAVRQYYGDVYNYPLDDRHTNNN